MIEIFPKPYAVYICPQCGGKDIRVADILYPNLHVLADCVCHSCAFTFYHDVPVGHALYYPAVIGKETKQLYGKEINGWFHKSLLQSYLHPTGKKVSVQKKVYRECKEVIVLNCLDYLYGHVLLKLFNAQHYIDTFPELGLIIIIPKSMEWLVPEGAAEIWSVDIKLRDMREWFTELHECIKNELTRFAKVYLSLAFSHPDFARIDIQRFTKVHPFKLENFSATPPVITFIAREDRLWFSSRFEDYLDIIATKFTIFSIIKKSLVAKQNRKIKHFCAIMQSVIPGVTINVLGIGEKRNLPDSVHDLRETKMNEVMETEWCNVYAKSNIVIGVHGSNMLLPTALAAGFIEILPESRYQNFLQDISASHQGIEAHFLYRFIYEFATPKQLANMAISMLQKYEEFHQRSSNDINEHKLYTDVTMWSEKK